MSQPSYEGDPHLIRLFERSQRLALPLAMTLEEMGSVRWSSEIERDGHRYEVSIEHVGTLSDGPD